MQRTLPLIPFVAAGRCTGQALRGDCQGNHAQQAGPDGGCHGQRLISASLTLPALFPRVFHTEVHLYYQKDPLGRPRPTLEAAPGPRFVAGRLACPRLLGRHRLPSPRSAPLLPRVPPLPLILAVSINAHAIPWYWSNSKPSTSSRRSI